MARVSLEELRKRKLQVNQPKLDATTEDEIEAQAEADGEERPMHFALVRHVLPPRQVRERLRMTQAEFAEALTVPIGTIRNWEQGRTVPDPAARALLTAVTQSPSHVLSALNPARLSEWLELEMRVNYGLGDDDKDDAWDEESRRAAG